MALRIPTFLESAEGFMQEFDDSVDGISLNSLVIGGGSESAGNISLSGSGKVVDLVDPTNPQDAATKTWVEDLVNGLDHKEAVRLASNANANWTGTATADYITGTGVLTISALTAGSTLGLLDVIEAVSGDRVLLKDLATISALTTDGGAEGTPGKYNGLWDVTGGTTTSLTLTRTEDANTSAEVTDGLSTWVGEGATHADQRWTLSTNETITLNTTDLVFIQTSGSGSIPVGTATSGGTGAVIGRLGGDSDEGITITSGIVKANIDAVTIDFDGGGQMNVTGVPLNFEVNGVATGSTVTAANFDTLTDGSNADALHLHASSPATEAPKIEEDYVLNENCSLGDPVYWQANDKVGCADAAVDAKARVIGVLRLAGLATESRPVVTVGPCTGVLTSLSPTVNDPVFLASGGGMTLTRPSAANRIIRTGYAKNADDLFVMIADLGKRVA